MVAQTARIAAWADCTRLEVFSGARKSRACAAAMASIASTLRVFSMIALQLVGRGHAHGDESSLLPEVVMESTEAG